MRAFLPLLLIACGPPQLGEKCYSPEGQGPNVCTTGLTCNFTSLGCDAESDCTGFCVYACSSCPADCQCTTGNGGTQRCQSLPGKGPVKGCAP